MKRTHYRLLDHDGARPADYGPLTVEFTGHAADRLRALARRHGPGNVAALAHLARACLLRGIGLVESDLEVTRKREPEGVDL